ncbi:MAG: TIR domain-containing protein [Thermoleophilia bacterium]|nr:TIR domain-containing protein [Thermoleophilia bacterium]
MDAMHGEAMSMEHRVFLSYATQDVDSASGVCEVLEADGIGCWLGSRDAPATRDKAAANLKAIRGADLVLLLFSASANASSSVLRDIERAIAYERPVLSLHLDDAAPNDSLEYYLNVWQWLDASGDLEGRRHAILAAVQAQLAGTPEPASWRWLDAPEGVDGKREEIVAAVRSQLARAPASAESRESQAALAATSTATQQGLFARLKTVARRRPSRRTWAIAAGTALAALAIGLGLGLGLPGGDRQGVWTRLSPEGAVPHVPNAPLMYDSTAERPVLMVDGNSTLNAKWDPNALPVIEVWAYDPVANSWAEIAPTGSVQPPQVGAFAMTYEPTTRRLIVFGGSDRTVQIGPEEWQDHPTSDTWAFDPATGTWTDLEPTGTSPPARLEGALAYDPAGRRLILFGGVTAGRDPGPYKYGDTWAYDPLANIWTELKPSGAVPSARSSKMVYDPASGRMIMFGSAGETDALNDTWAYDPVANDWTDLAPSGPLPKKRAGFGMAYDAASHRALIFGGCNRDGSRFFNDTWAYDPVDNTWTELKPSGPLPRACIASMAYDTATDRLIMFGGGGPDQDLNDTWAFTP